jgi:predicted metal-dependent hydrolase
MAFMGYNRAMAKVEGEKENGRWPVKVIRSKRRRKTVEARVQNGELVVRAPASMSSAELEPIIDKLQKRLARRAAPASDELLEKMARELNQLYFNGRLHWQSIRFVTNQNKRYGSCTPSQGTIRLSHRLAPMPPWVLKYVLLHELAHLQEPNHGSHFWALVNQYPLTERARGFLMGAGFEESE